MLGADVGGAFVEYLLGLGLSDRTVRLYAADLRRAAGWFARTGRDLAHPNPSDFAAFASTLPNSNSTRIRIRCALHHFYDWQGTSAPLKALRVPPRPAMVCKALEDDEARALVKTALGWWPHGAMVLLGLYLGLRREEIAKAEWGRFDETLGWYTVTGKGDKTATLPVHPVLQDEFSPRRSTGFIFPGTQGREWVTPATVWAYTKKVARAAGLGDVRTHQLRHTALTIANDVTGDLRAVQTFARHSRPETTAGYTRTTARRLREVSQALDYLNGGR